MTRHDVLYEGRLPSRSGGPSRNRLFELGWAQFWLLSGILGAVLAMLVLVLFAHLSAV